MVVAHLVNAQQSYAKINGFDPWSYPQQTPIQVEIRLD